MLSVLVSEKIVVQWGLCDGGLACPQGFGQCFDKEEFAPHDGFVNTEIFFGVVHAVFQNAFPTGGFDGQVLRIA